MKKKPAPGPGALAAWVCAGVLTLSGGGLLAMYFLAGWHPLLLSALAVLMPALAQLLLWIPRGRKPEAPQIPEEAPEGKKEKRRLAWKKACYQGKTRWYAWRDGAVALLIALAVLGAHLVFWRFKPVLTEKLNYLIPVLLAVLFVVFIVLEKWCAHSADNAAQAIKARLRGLGNAMSLCRIALLLTLAVAVLRLLGVYDASTILCTVLSILFVYETAMLVFSLAVRLIRKELGSCPELLVSVHGMGKDMNILTYLEENTGITMRSLWSLQLMKKLLPPAILALVLVMWLSTGFVQIEAYQQGALFRLGKLHPKLLEPGFHMTLPWPFDSVDVYDTQSVSKMAIGYVPEGAQDNIWTESHGGEEYRLLLGGGAEIVSINLVVEYRISDLMHYIRSSAAPESLLQAQAYEIITARTISTDLDALLAADREVFAESFREELTAQLSQYNTGLEVVNVVLESIHPPVEIAYIYQDMISAGIDAEYLRIYAHNSANRYIMTAKEAATKAVAEAQANKLKAVGDAQAAVTEFMAAVSADSQYSYPYRFQKYMEAITKAYGNATLIIAGEGVDSRNIYIGSLTTPSPAAVPETTPSYYEGEEDIDEYEYDYADPI